MSNKYKRLGQIIKSDDILPPEVDRAYSNGLCINARYVKLEQLSSGSLGDVWKCYDITLRRYVAIKFLVGLDENTKNRFFSEAQLAARLSHPNIVKIYDFGNDGPLHYIIMNYIEGKSIDKIFLEPKKITEIMYIVTKAVAHFHSFGIVHRDLKPQNILLDKNDHIWIVDFGLAKDLSDPRSMITLNSVFGTAAYISPEQARGEKPDIQSDLYGLGATFYHLATGYPPFESKNTVETLQKVLKENPVPPSRLDKMISSNVELVILKAMNKDKKYRYKTAIELAYDIQRLYHGHPIQAKPQSTAARILSSVKKSNIAMALAIIFLTSLFWILVFTVFLKGSNTNKTYNDSPATSDIDRNK